MITDNKNFLQSLGVEDDELDEVDEEETDDTVVDDVTPEAEEESDDFTQNLATVISDDVLEELGQKYLRYAKKDADDRSQRYARYAEGLEKTGLSPDSQAAPSIDGGSNLIYPVLSEAAIDFQSSTIAELFPASGPVKISPTLDASLSSLQKARRKMDYLNREITIKTPEFRSELEKLLSQLPLAGNCYRKFWWNSRYKRFDVQFLPVDKVLVPYSARSFYTSSRITIVEDLSVSEIRRRVRSKYYRDVLEVSDEDTSDITFIQKPAEVNDTIEDKSESEPTAGFRTILEIYCDMELEDDKYADESWGTAPYVMTVDSNTGSVLSIYRNWAQEDEGGRKKDHVVEWCLIPWRGAYAIGLTHIAGALAGALSGMIRVMMDNAVLTTAPMGLIGTGRDGINGQNIRLQPGTWSQVEMPYGTNLRDSIMPVPFNPIPQAMFELFGSLDKVTRGLLQTSLDQIGLDNTTVPVGTQMARIEQGLKVYRSIFARMHESLRRELEVICRLYAEHMEPVYAKDAEGNVINKDDEETPVVYLSAEDFEDSADLAPVSDPDVFSETQRVVKSQLADSIVTQLREQDPAAVDMKAYARTKLERMNYPNLQQILPDKVQSSNDNPAVENVKMSSGQMATALPDQDHLNHIKVHLGYLKMVQETPFYKEVLPFMLQHVKQHILMYYTNAILEAVNHVTDEDVSKWNTRDMATANRLSALIASVQPTVEAQLTQQLGEIVAAVGMMQQEVQQMMTPPPKPTPEELLVQAEIKKEQNNVVVKNADMKLKAEKQEQQFLLEQEKLAQKSRDLDIREKQMATAAMIQTYEVEEKTQRNDDDNDTQLMITLMNKGMENEQPGRPTEVIV